MTQGALATSPESTDPAMRALLRDVARPRMETPPPAVVAGRYRIHEPLGSGGMGTVYRALDERLGRHVALKWMHFHEHDGLRDAAFARFVREARAAALVRHPNVVQVLDVSADASTPFIIMELLEGESLRDRLARGRLSWAQAIPIIGSILDGLAALHAVGVVHRDIKPSNVFLTRGGESDAAVKVLDLGVAHIAEAEGLSGLTGTGTQLGTPAYMPLEQLRGERVGASADLYAVGVVLYEVVAGVRPFAARTAADLAVQIAITRAPDLDASHGVSGTQNAVLQRALSRDPAQRFPSADAFKAALRGEPRTSRPSARHGVMALVAVLMAGGFVMAATASMRSSTESARPVERRVADAVPPSQLVALPSESRVDRPDDASAEVAGSPATEPATTTFRRERRAGARTANTAPSAPQPAATVGADGTAPRLHVSEFERPAAAPRPAIRQGEF